MSLPMPIFKTFYDPKKKDQVFREYFVKDKCQIFSADSIVKKWKYKNLPKDINTETLLNIDGYMSSFGDRDKWIIERENKLYLNCCYGLKPNIPEYKWNDEADHISKMLLSESDFEVMVKWIEDATNLSDEVKIITIEDKSSSFTVGKLLRKILDYYFPSSVVDTSADSYNGDFNDFKIFICVVKRKNTQEEIDNFIAKGVKRIIVISSKETYKSDIRPKEHEHRDEVNTYRLLDDIDHEVLASHFKLEACQQKNLPPQKKNLPYQKATDIADLKDIEEPNYNIMSLPSANEKNLPPQKKNLPYQISEFVTCLYKNYDKLKIYNGVNDNVFTPWTCIFKLYKAQKYPIKLSTVTLRELLRESDIVSSKVTIRINNKRTDGVYLISRKQLLSIINL